MRCGLAAHAGSAPPSVRSATGRVLDVAVRAGLESALDPPRDALAHHLGKLGDTTLMQTNELASMLELCYGDADDESGLDDLRAQLGFYPERAVVFRAQLDELIASGDADACKTLLERYVHRFLSGPQALAWLRDLSQQLGEA